MSKIVQQEPEGVQSRLTIVTSLASHSIPFLLPFVQPLRYRFFLPRIRPGNAAEDFSIPPAIRKVIFRMETLRRFALLEAFRSPDTWITAACISKHYTRLDGNCAKSDTGSSRIVSKQLKGAESDDREKIKCFEGRNLTGWTY